MLLILWLATTSHYIGHLLLAAKLLTLYSLPLLTIVVVEVLTVEMLMVEVMLEEVQLGVEEEELTVLHVGDATRKVM